ncbi:MAG: alpha/beta hydrolase [Ignavibacteriaceae bacterium]|nr:alpha/beta hydrolase [Ignavibacteriaceae bacterium]
MEIEKISKIGGISVPTFKITPAEYNGIVLNIHGYGGNKEEMLGLSQHISEYGFLTYTIDMPGHGENEKLFDENTLDEIKQIADLIKENGKKLVVIGHSLGGRYALLCDCDYAIGLSPALNKEFSKQTQDIITNLRSYRVNEKYAGINFDILRNIPACISKAENTKILIGSRDVPEIIQVCEEYKAYGYDVVKMENVLHSDIFNSNKTFKIITDTIQKWFNKN